MVTDSSANLGLARPVGSSLALSVMALVLCVDAAWLLASGRSISPQSVVLAALVMATLLGPLLIPRYRCNPRVRTTACALALSLGFTAAGCAFSYLVVSTDAPLVDATLERWDLALGFDWRALHGWLQSHAYVRSGLRYAYQNGLYQILLVVLFLGLTGREARLRQFLGLYFLAAVLTVVLSGPFPAEGAWKHYAMGGAFDLSSLSHFEQLRSGAMRELPLQLQQGLVAMPSMHAAMAVLLVFAVRQTLLLGPSAALNLAMLASTPIDGGHYLVDVLAGIALALVLIAASRKE